MLCCLLPVHFVSFHNNQSVTPIYLYYRSQFLQFVNFRITFAKIAFHLQQTPLHVAASQGHCYIVEYFVQQGADVSIKDNDGVSVNILLVILVISIELATKIPRIYLRIFFCAPVFEICKFSMLYILTCLKVSLCHF